MNTCLLTVESAISVLLNFTLYMSFSFKEIAILTPAFASGGMTYCSASHGRSRAILLQVSRLDQVPIIQQVTQVEVFCMRHASGVL